MVIDLAAGFGTAARTNKPGMLSCSVATAKLFPVRSTPRTVAEPVPAATVMTPLRLNKATPSIWIDGDSIVTPPESSRMIALDVVRNTLRPGLAGGGGSPSPQKPPTQTGRLGSPSSNSTHTLAPCDKTVNRPTPGPA